MSLHQEVQEFLFFVQYKFEHYCNRQKRMRVTLKGKGFSLKGKGSGIA